MTQYNSTIFWDFALQTDGTIKRKKQDIAKKKLYIYIYISVKIILPLLKIFISHPKSVITLILLF